MLLSLGSQYTWFARVARTGTHAGAVAKRG